jgi:predicted molibdopterin-dependent oxidoreductase YjgC
VRDGNPIRIDSADPAGFKGQLCQKGRFYQLYEHHDRQLSPVVRDSNGELREASWSEAINRVIRRLGDTKKRFGPESIAGIASSVNCNESLRDFCTLMKKVVGTTKTDTLDGSAYRTIIQGARRAGIKPDLTHEAPLESILESDCVVLIGTEPLSSHPVAGCYVLRATNNNAHLITLDTRRDPFHYRIPLQLKTNEGQLGTALKAILGYVLTKKPNTDIPDIAIRKQVLLDDACNSAGLSKDAITHAGDILSSATNPVFIYGDGILRNGDSESVSDLLILASLTGGSTNKKRVLSLKPKGNSRGAWQSGLVNSEKNLIDEFSEKTMRAAWIMLSDDYIEEPTFLERLKKIGFIIVQASYKSPITALADVVLPSPVWSEREGTYTTLDGIVLDSKRVLPIPDLTREESPVIAEVGRQLTAKK